MGRYVGIDFGHTALKVSVFEGGEPYVLEDAQKNACLPALLAISGEGKAFLGEEAKRAMQTTPLPSLVYPKAHLGTDDRCVIEGENRSWSAISARLLARAVQMAEEYLGEETEGAVISVPSYYNWQQRRALEDAFAIATKDDKRLRLVSDGALAALGAIEYSQPTKWYLLCDGGGGGFTASVVQTGDGIFELLSQVGEARAGGLEFDIRLADYLSSRFAEQYGIDLSKDCLAWQRLLAEAEKARIALSARDTVKVFLPYIIADSTGAKHLDIDVSREAFENCTRDLIERMATSMRKALQNAFGTHKAKIDSVVLLGGMSRTPALVEAARRATGLEPTVANEPERCVARGAAVMAGVIDGSLKGVIALDTIGNSLWIADADGVPHVTIERDTTIPVRQWISCTTAKDDQKALSFELLEGEQPDNLKPVGWVQVTGLAPAKAGTAQVCLTLGLDVNGHISVGAVDAAAKQSLGVAVKGTLEVDGYASFPQKDDKPLYADALLRLGDSAGGQTPLTEESTGKLESTKAAREVLEAMLPVVDNLERALHAHQYTDNVEAIAKGVELTLRDMRKRLESFGVREIPAMGQFFDPRIHEAVEYGEGGRSGTVQAVYEKGYELDGVVLRCAKVKVSK